MKGNIRTTHNSPSVYDLLMGSQMRTLLRLLNLKEVEEFVNMATGPVSQAELKRREQAVLPEAELERRGYDIKKLPALEKRRAAPDWLVGCARPSVHQVPIFSSAKITTAFLKALRTLVDLWMFSGESLNGKQTPAARAFPEDYLGVTQLKEQLGKSLPAPDPEQTDGKLVSRLLDPGQDTLALLKGYEEWRRQPQFLQDREYRYSLNPMALHHPISCAYGVLALLLGDEEERYRIGKCQGCEKYFRLKTGQPRWTKQRGFKVYAYGLFCGNAHQNAARAKLDKQEDKELREWRNRFFIDTAAAELRRKYRARPLQELSKAEMRDIRDELVDALAVAQKRLPKEIPEHLHAAVGRTLDYKPTPTIVSRLWPEIVQTVEDSKSKRKRQK
jgi:hypothetical protein